MSLVNTYGECNDECDRAPSQKLFRNHRRRMQSGIMRGLNRGKEKTGN